MSTRQGTAGTDELHFPVALSMATCRHHTDTVGSGNSSPLGHGELQGCKAEKHLHSTHISEQIY